MIRRLWRQGRVKRTRGPKRRRALSRGPAELSAIRLPASDRASLLRSTALASTLLVGSLFAATDSHAQVITIVNSPTPVTYSNATDCISATHCIFISTVNDGSYIDLYNSGALNAG